jgi:hypothetical protein
MIDFNKTELSSVATLSGRLEFKVFLEWLDRCHKDALARLYRSATDREQHFLISEAATMNSIIGKCQQARERESGAATPDTSGEFL